jgi:hypothetical protein
LYVSFIFFPMFVWSQDRFLVLRMLLVLLSTPIQVQAVSQRTAKYVSRLSNTVVHAWNSVIFIFPLLQLHQAIFARRHIQMHLHMKYLKPSHARDDVIKKN